MLASLVSIVTPGQDMVLVMSRSIAQGTAAGVVIALGRRSLLRLSADGALSNVGKPKIAVFHFVFERRP